MIDTGRRNKWETYDYVKAKIEGIKNTPPSKAFVQEQIDNIYVTNGNGKFQIDRIIAALQALLELVEAYNSTKPEADS